MINLILNENMKIYRRWGPWIMVAILVVIAILFSLVMKSISSYNADDWKVNVKQQLQSEQQALKDNAEHMPQIAKDRLQDDIKIKQYQLEHDIIPEGNTFWGAVQGMTGMIVLVTIFTVIVAGGIVAGEFSRGTIKLLLIRPVNRWKILLSKYIASFLYSLFLLLLLFLTAVIVNALLYGTQGIGTPHLYVNHAGEVAKSPLVLYTLGVYGLACVQLIMIVTLAFMISSVFRNNAFAIGISIFLMFVGEGVTAFLLAKYEWARYILFANWNLSTYLNGSPPTEGMTMQFSILVLLGYFIVFNALSWGVFTKRDVAA